MKCPVCKTTLLSGDTKCNCCDFSELQHEFINADDAATWFENVVVPFRIEWEKKKSEPSFLTANELYAQMVAKQNKRISNYINEANNEFETRDFLTGVEIIRYNGNSTHVVIPDKIYGKPVLKLCDSLFENCEWITAVTLPNGLTTIGNSVFENTALTRITLPYTVKEIGNRAFARSAITEIIFPPSIKLIPNKVCDSCEKLNTVIIMGAEEIGEEAFRYCKSIAKLLLPETLIVINKEAFSCCHALDNIVLPVSLQRIYGNFHGSLNGSIVVLNDNLIWRGFAYIEPRFIRNITIYCNPGSTSQQHARQHGMKMKLLSEYKHQEETIL